MISARYGCSRDGLGMTRQLADRITEATVGYRALDLARTFASARPKASELSPTQFIADLECWLVEPDGRAPQQRLEESDQSVLVHRLRNALISS